MKDSVSERIQKAITDSKKTLLQLEKESGVPHAAIQRYATGKTNKIPIDRLRAIAKETGVSPAWIMGWVDDIHDADTNITQCDMTNSQARFLQKYRQLHYSQKRMIERMVEGFLEEYEYQRHTEKEKASNEEAEVRPVPHSSHSRR